MIALILAMQATTPRALIVDPEKHAKAVSASSDYRSCLERYAKKMDDHVSEAKQIGAAVAPYCDRQANRVAEVLIQNDPVALTMRERLLSIYRSQRVWEATQTVLKLRNHSR